MLNPGTKLGLYEILSPLGAGGMGEVYRAKDSRLDREVAIKVLPEAFARDTAEMPEGVLYAANELFGGLCQRSLKPSHLGSLQNQPV